MRQGQRGCSTRRQALASQFVKAKTRRFDKDPNKYVSSVLPSPDATYIELGRPIAGRLSVLGF